jgi:(5-formylfuran-3-yl)methyl phosphate synthase
MKILISVRDSAEALLAARGGADFIDAKEPGQGALGGLPEGTIAEIVAALRAAHGRLPISATVGDWPMQALAEISARVDAVAACGVDYVKVGITRDPGAREVLDMLARCGHAIVPVFIADRGLDAALIEYALALRFPAVMADTADKRAGSLFDAVPMAALQAFVGGARASGTQAGLAGALQAHDAAALAELAPDFAGFRSAVCVGGRNRALDAQRLADLLESLRSAQPA